jgi:glycosyltransferase involved in cell wall biosynthesis
MDNCGWAIRVVTLSSESEDFYRLAPAIDRVALDSTGISKNLWMALAQNWSRIKRLRNSVATFKPTVVLVFGARTNVLVLLALKGMGIPIVVSERTDPFALNIGFPWHQLRPWLYRGAAQVVAQTKSVSERIMINWRLPNVVVIPNPLARELPALMEAKPRRKILLSVGRLSKEKGHDILIEAWGQIHREFPDWYLRIVGEGSEKMNLEEQASRLGQHSNVEFVGISNSVFHEYQLAQVFILPSRREGFPNALLEALASGCICIAADCKSGPADILENGKLGYLYSPNTPEKLASMIKVALREQSSEYKLINIKKIRAQYNIDAVCRKWMALLKQTGKK